MASRNRWLKIPHCLRGGKGEIKQMRAHLLLRESNCEQHKMARIYAMRCLVHHVQRGKPRSRHRASHRREAFLKHSFLMSGLNGRVISEPFWKVGTPIWGSIWKHFRGSGRLWGAF